MRSPRFPSRIKTLASIAIPLLFEYASQRNGGIPIASLSFLLNTYTFLFVVIASIIPAAIASYSLVGDRVEKSLEPLLATPTTDSEILLGKSIPAFVLPIAAVYAACTLFMALVDELNYGRFGYAYFPNWDMAIVLIALAPLACLFSVEVSIIISARSSDVRSAQQASAMTAFPLFGVLLLSQLMVFSLDTNNLLIIAGILLFLDIGLFFISKSTFQREEILTKWK